MSTFLLTQAPLLSHCSPGTLVLTRDRQGRQRYARTRKVTALGFEPIMDLVRMEEERELLLDWVARNKPRRRNRTLSVPGKNGFGSKVITTFRCTCVLRIPFSYTNHSLCVLLFILFLHLLGIDFNYGAAGVGSGTGVYGVGPSPRQALGRRSLIDNRQGSASRARSFTLSPRVTRDYGDPLP